MIGEVYRMMGEMYRMRRGEEVFRMRRLLKAVLSLV